MIGDWNRKEKPLLGLQGSGGGLGYIAGRVSAVAAFLEYLTTSDTSSFTLLSSGIVNYEVDWGDGTVETLTTNNPTHTYSSAGEYTIKITPAEGSTYRPDFDNAISDTSIASVSGTGGSQLGTRLERSWYGASNMTSFSADIDTSGVTNFRDAWRDCSSLTSFPLLNTSNGIDFDNAWYNCSGLTSFPLLNTSNGIDFKSAWINCSGLTSFPQLDTSSGTDFFATWQNCTGLTTFPSINTSSVTNFGRAWYGCSGITTFPQLDTSNGIDFGQAWRDCSSLTSFPLLNTSSGTSFTRAWRNCSGLTSFPLLITSSGTNFSFAWSGCTGITTFPLIDTSSATSVEQAWNDCRNLVEFPALDFSNVTGSFRRTWYFCTSLTTFPANMFDNIGTTSSTGFQDAFRSCDLTAQSIENILVSLDTCGASNIELGINAGNNASKSTWSTAANTAYNNLITKGWTISYNP